MAQDPKVKQEQPAGSPFSEDYHDYVFRDGKLVGDFDNMYRYSKEVPWHQDRTCDEWTTEVGLLMIKDLAPYDTILEVGCGIGYVAAKLKQFLGRTGGSVDALDLSPEAIRTAKIVHPGINFYVANLADPSFHPERQYDLVVVKEVFWYVCDNMSTVVSNLDRCVGPNGLLYIGQFFPELGSDFVGKDIIPTPQAMMDYFPNYKPVSTAILKQHTSEGESLFLHFLAVRGS